MVKFTPEDFGVLEWFPWLMLLYIITPVWWVHIGHRWRQRDRIVLHGSNCYYILDLAPFCYRRQTSKDTNYRGGNPPLQTLQIDICRNFWQEWQLKNQVWFTNLLKQDWKWISVLNASSRFKWPKVTKDDKNDKN